MNKKIIKIFIILIFCLFLFENYSYGFIKDDYADNILFFIPRRVLVMGWVGNGNTSEKILKDLKSKLGYEGDSLTEEMKCKTYLKIVEVNNKKYKIQFRRKWIFNSIYC